MHLNVALPIIAVLAALLVFAWAKLREARRAEFIRTYTLPPGLFDKLREKRPELTLKDCQLVGHALRQYFLVYLRSGRKYVSMPSQVVDDLWHELILYTRHYQAFCRLAFGRFMHHTPAVVLSTARRSNEGLRRCWHFACLEENINPRKATRLPLLFALDKKLGITDGFIYEPNCKSEAARAKHGDRAVHCGGDFSTTGCGGGGDGGGGDASGHGCSGGCSGGCGGGCGGGD